MGFTLVELLAVVAIIGILAALLAPGVGRMIDQSRSAKSLANKRQIYSALTLYHNDFNRLPSLIQVNQDSNAWNLDSGWHTIISPYLNHDEFTGEKRVGASDVSICPRADKHSKRGDYGIAYSQTRGPVRKETRNATGQVVSSDLSLSFVQISNLGKTSLQEGWKSPVEVLMNRQTPFSESKPHPQQSSLFESWEEAGEPSAAEAHLLRSFVNHTRNSEQVPNPRDLPPRKAGARLQAR
jgi:prepilin-type N-terminal cleavage/methylation domain-containing protein